MNAALLSARQGLVRALLTSPPPHSPAKTRSICEQSLETTSVKVLANCAHTESLQNLYLFQVMPTLAQLFIRNPQYEEAGSKGKAGWEWRALLW